MSLKFVIESHSLSKTQYLVLFHRKFSRDSVGGGLGERIKEKCDVKAHERELFRTYKKRKNVFSLSRLSPSNENLQSY